MVPSGYTSGMSPLVLSPRRRLLGVGALSLSLHLLAIAWIDTQLRLPLPSAGSPALSVRLTDVALATDRAAAPATPQPAPPLQDAQAEPPSDAPFIISSAPDAVPAQAPPPVVADVAPDPVLGEGGVAVRTRMPGRYRVLPPPPARLTYTVQSATADGATSDDGAAQLAWRSDGVRYRLQMDGVLGELSSEGDIVDTGVAPRTRFERAQGAIVAGPDNDSYQLAEGSQDTASVLAQLAGMGLAEPEQMQDVLEFWVAGASGARIERFEVLGPEQLATGAGLLATLRLRQLAEPGARQLEVWLAPQHSWMPVQLRLTSGDGATRTQTVDAIRIEAAPESAQP